jgi:homoserine kinase type II
MNNVLNKSIREDIFEAITSIWGLNILDFTIVDLGYMNLKWILKTDHGDFFAKQYNKSRYPEHMVEGLEISLNHQNTLYNSGIPCPELYTHNGKYVIKSTNDERFVLMKFCEGHNLKAGTANEQQMFHLGQIIGKMHMILNSNNRINIPLHWDVRTKESMFENWKERWNEAIRIDCQSTLSTLDTQRKIIEKNDVHIFSDCEIGWSHWDLFADNILFKNNLVSAILDFDRINYVYREFDISRPLLSFCIENGKIHLGCVAAFVKGYREFQPLSNQKLVRSFKLTWWKEAEWVSVKMQNSAVIKRFNEENVWVGDHWDHLEDIFAILD